MGRLIAIMLAVIAGASTAQAQQSCTSNFDCGVGITCLKPAGSFRGFCGTVVNEYGNREYGGTPAECNSDFDCGMGARCKRASGMYKGLCVKR